MEIERTELFSNKKSGNMERLCGYMGFWGLRSADMDGGMANLLGIWMYRVLGSGICGSGLGDGELAFAAGVRRDR